MHVDWFVRFGLGIAVSVVTLAPACGASVNLVAVTGQVHGPQARVELTEIDGDILKFMVFNLSEQNMVLLRDQVVLKTASGLRHREAGGITNVYNVPAGGAHDLNVKFDLAGTKSGEQLEVHFERALLVGDRPIQIDPIVVSVK